jgi:tetratricopeptide (TPR) repeat protein
MEKMRNSRKTRRLLVAACFTAISIQFVAGCSRPDWFVGVNGAYNEGKFEVMRRINGNLDKAIGNFEYIAKENPAYRDTLTLLGRAYYKKARYRDSHVILQRAVALNNQDDFAWLQFGAVQLRLGDDERGLESVRGGLTLYTKATATDKYRGYTGWDPAGKVRIASRRAVFVALKGLEQKEDLIKSVEAVLLAVEDEEFFQMFEKTPLQQRQYE